MKNGRGRDCEWIRHKYTRRRRRSGREEKIKWNKTDWVCVSIFLLGVYRLGTSHHTATKRTPLLNSKWFWVSCVYLFISVSGNMKQRREEKTGLEHTERQYITSYFISPESRACEWASAGASFVCLTYTHRLVRVRHLNIHCTFFFCRLFSVVFFYLFQYFVMCGSHFHNNNSNKNGLWSCGCVYSLIVSLCISLEYSCHAQVCIFISRVCSIVALVLFVVEVCVCRCCCCHHICLLHLLSLSKVLPHSWLWCWWWWSIERPNAWCVAVTWICEYARTYLPTFA